MNWKKGDISREIIIYAKLLLMQWKKENIKDKKQEQKAKK